MEKVEQNIFQKFCHLSQQVQKFQQKISQESVTPEKRVCLHRELESLHENLDMLKESAISIQSQAKSQFTQFDEIERQIVSMYKGIEDRFEEHEVFLISKEAMDLGSSLESGKIFRIAKQVDQLNHNIHFFFQHRRPSMKHRKIVHLALKLVDHAQGMISSRKPSNEQIRLIHLLKGLLEEALFDQEPPMSVEEAENIMELYEIADLLRHRKENEGKLKLHLLRGKLTTAQKNRLDGAKTTEELIVALLALANGDPCIEWKETPEPASVIHVLQA